jgi:hypothetical protein
LFRKSAMTMLVERTEFFSVAITDVGFECWYFAVFLVCHFSDYHRWLLCITRGIHVSVCVLVNLLLCRRLFLGLRYSSREWNYEPYYYTNRRWRLAGRWKMD